MTIIVQGVPKKRTKFNTPLFCSCESQRRVVFTHFVFTGRQQSLSNILVQTMRFYGGRFKIYHVQNFVRLFFWNTLYSRSFARILLYSNVLAVALGYVSAKVKCS